MTEPISYVFEAVVINMLKRRRKVLILSMNGIVRLDKNFDIGMYSRKNLII